MCHIILAAPTNNRHFKVPRPEGNCGDDPDITKSLQFHRYVNSFAFLMHFFCSHKTVTLTWIRANLFIDLPPCRWVHLLHTGYISYCIGKHSSFNENHINRLLELGFEFEDESIMKLNVNKSPIPEIPFKTRLEQVWKCHQEMGSFKIDYRYKNMHAIC